MIKFILGFLLHHANRYPLYFLRENGHAIKSMLLQKHGTLIGYDLQQITQGLYNKDYQLLKKYRIGKFFFRLPYGVIYPSAQFINLFKNRKIGLFIDGLIKLKKSRYSIECNLWLFLLFDRKNFFRALGTFRVNSNFFLPLSYVFSLVYVLKTIMQSAKKSTDEEIKIFFRAMRQVL